MDGIGGLDALLVVRGVALGGKLRPLRTIQIGKGAGSTVALAISPSGAELTVRGAARLMVDGTDVAQRQRSCASVTDA